MRAVFFGTPELALPSLEAVAARHEIRAVVCQPDKPQGRSGQPVPPPTKVWANAYGIEVVQPVKLNDGIFAAWLASEAPDICFLIAYGRILKQPLLDIPIHGFLNVHPSQLPKYRGPSPIQTAILNGETETGVSIMRLDAGMDTGDVVLQERFAITEDDTTATLSERLGQEGARMLVQAADLVERGEAVFMKQDGALATSSRIYSKEDGRIRWTATARIIHNLVRAAVPWPTAHCKLGADVCRIHRTAVTDETTDAAPGTVVRVERDRLIVATGQGALALLSLQLPGKRAMDAADFLRGHKIDAGTRFEEI